MTRLTTAVSRYPTTEALFDGAVSRPDVELEFVDFGPAIARTFPKMIRESAYDLSEMGATGYLPALDFGVPLYGLPIFPSRNFGFGSVMVNERSGITEPADLAGKRVGVRTYTVTAAVWVRAMLAELYGVDPASITWCIEADEPLADFEWPDNVEHVGNGNIAGLLEAGELAAGIAVYRGSAPHIVPLFSDADAVERAWYDKTKVLPIHHLMVIRRELVDENPGLVSAVGDLFGASKARFMERLASGGGGAADPAAAALAGRRELVGPDPVPYGIEANRRALEALIRYSKDQKMLKGDYAVEDLFAPEAE